MNAGSGFPTALIVDDDVAFILWVGEMFAESGYQSVPALHCRQAMALLNKLALRVDVLVLNPKLRGAARTVKALEAEYPKLRVVLIGDPSALGSGLGSNHVTLDRPSAWEPISRPQWVAKIRKALLRLSVVK